MAVGAPLFRPREDSLRAYATGTVQAFMGAMERHVAAVPEIAEAALPFEEFFEAEHSRLFRALLHGRNLACWCPLPEPGQPDHCHAAVLLELANTA